MEENKDLFEEWEKEYQKLKKRQKQKNKIQDNQLEADVIIKPLRKRAAKADNKDQQDKECRAVQQINTQNQTIDYILTGTQVEQVAIDQKDIKFEPNKSKPRKNFEVGKNVVKIEDGMIKYEYTNSFNIRVNNYMKKSHLSKDMEKYIHQQQIEEQNQQIEKYKRLRKDGPFIKDEEVLLFCGNTQTQNVRIKNEGDTQIIVEAEDDCQISKIDYSKRLPDFTKIPHEVIKEELQKNGYRTSKFKKSDFTRFMIETWQYKKQGVIPKNYSEDN
ncbi:UNKNOWN [Stylonychia lemnae]|uniref:Uncharacterized protein n=1 Tax=Stylonychia lemnae TaxID=5949 RepID=A0A078ATQ8_STYLE|nr:UNKNOWN [Stylonychia lemnae]|eukprot:CDW84228.1 UNKNOWN [Stylonychia lemnae]